MIDIHGHCRLIVREGDEIVQDVEDDNLITDMNRYLVTFQGFANTSYGLPNGTIYMCVMNIGVSPKYRSNFIVGVTNGAARAPDATSRDVNGRTVTFTTTFPSPGTDRTVKTVGLIGTSYYTAGGNAYKGFGPMCSVLRLSSQVVQTTTQTLEMQYRLTFAR